MVEPSSTACTCTWKTVNAGYVSGIGSGKEYVGPIDVRVEDPSCPKHSGSSLSARLTQNEHERPVDE